MNKEINILDKINKIRPSLHSNSNILNNNIANKINNSKINVNNLKRFNTLNDIKNTDISLNENLLKNKRPKSQKIYIRKNPEIISQQTNMLQQWNYLKPYDKTKFDYLKFCDKDVTKDIMYVTKSYVISKTEGNNDESAEIDRKKFALLKKHALVKAIPD